MEKTLIYDWPTRIFHWLFAGMFIAAFFIAKTFDDESAIYPYHMLLGLSMALIVLLRIVWGIVGSRNAKFTSFSLGPKELVNYLKAVIGSKNQHNAAHNPASSWIAIIMMFLALGLAVTGYLMTVKVYKEVFEEIHEVFANAFVVAAILHVSGIVLHTLRYKDGIGLSMLHGLKKIENVNESGIAHPYRLVGVLFSIMILLFLIYLNNNYDRQKQNLVIFNKSIQLGEGEKNSLEFDEKKTESKYEDEHENE